MIWFLSLFMLASPALAQKAVMEGVAASRYAIKVDTTNGRVDVATTSYNWGIANVGLHVASNVVVDTLTTKNAVVFYATGTVRSYDMFVSSIIWANGSVSTGAVTSGVPGPTGATGVAGSTGTISVGTTASVSSTTVASVTDTGTSTAAVLNFYIPKGADGATGPTGAAGSNGVSVGGGGWTSNDTQVWLTTQTAPVTIRSSATVNGSGGLLSASSVTASAFFGDGSHLTGMVSTGSVLLAGVAVPTGLVDLSTVTSALSGKQASGSYITSLTGPVTASGPGAATTAIVGPVPQAAVNLSTVTTALASKLDNTTAIPGSLIDMSTYTFGGGGGSITSDIFVTSRTIFLSDLTLQNNTSLGPCIAGTTVTVTTGISAPLTVMWHATAYKGGASIPQTFSILIDGAFVDPAYTSATTRAMTGMYDNVAATRHNIEINFPTTASYAAGSHSACLTTATDGGGAGVATTAQGLPYFALRGYK